MAGPGPGRPRASSSSSISGLSSSALGAGDRPLSPPSAGAAGPAAKQLPCQLPVLCLHLPLRPRGGTGPLNLHSSLPVNSPGALPRLGPSHPPPYPALYSPSHRSCSKTKLNKYTGTWGLILDQLDGISARSLGAGHFYVGHTYRLRAT